MQPVAGDHDKLLDFAEVLYASGHFADSSALFYMLRKPWKWQKEYEKWVAAGKPLTIEDEQ